MAYRDAAPRGHARSWQSDPGADVAASAGVWETYGSYSRRLLRRISLYGIIFRDDGSFARFTMQIQVDIDLWSRLTRVRASFNTRAGKRRRVGSLGPGFHPGTAANPTGGFTRRSGMGAGHGAAVAGHRPARAAAGH